MAAITPLTFSCTEVNMERLHWLLVKHKAFQFDTEEGAAGLSLYIERG
jgi:hypothetical protein